MRINVSNTLDDLTRDTSRIATTARGKMSRAVREEARLGNELAKGFAHKSAGAHGKHYPNAFSIEAITPLAWEYGPDASMPQGGMSFEHGSRNQPPHNDLAKSADIVGPRLGGAVLNEVDGMFWGAEA